MISLCIYQKQRVNVILYDFKLHQPKIFFIGQYWNLKYALLLAQILRFCSFKHYISIRKFAKMIQTQIILHNPNFILHIKTLMFLDSKIIALKIRSLTFYFVSKSLTLLLWWQPSWSRHTDKATFSQFIFVDRRIWVLKWSVRIR